jgi:hypothetical protein
VLKLQDKIMAWKNLKNNQLVKDRPDRLRKDDGMTMTGELITDQLLLEYGWVWEEVEEFIPEIDEINTGTNATIGD